MTTELFANTIGSSAASTTLAGNGGSITAIATTLLVASATGFSVTNGQMRAVIEPGSSNAEIVIITGISTLTFTVARGAEGTTAVIHNDGAAIVAEVTAGALGTMLQSVTLAVPADESVSGSPLAGPSGTITISRNTQSANQFLGGPDSGAAAAPTYRGLTSTDVEIAPGPAWNGYIAWNYDPILLSAALAPTAGTVYLAKLMCPYAYTINTIDVSINTGGTGATSLLNCFLGIYDSGGTRQFVSADQASVWNSSGVKALTVSGGYTVTAADYIYIAFLIGTQSTTACVFDIFFPSSNGGPFNTANLTVAKARAAINGTGKTALATSLVLTSNANTNKVPWVAVH